jgi:hypothetical protein
VAPAAPAAEPQDVVMSAVETASPVVAAPAPLPVLEVGGRPLPAAPALEPAADSPMPSGLLVAAAGALLALTTLLFVRRLRAGTLRAR